MKSYRLEGWQKVYFVVAVVIMSLLAGCAGMTSGKYSRPTQSNGGPEIVSDLRYLVVPAGCVPVVFPNPNSGLRRHEFLFEGGGRVEMVPDSRTGGWMFNRRAIKEFYIEPANDSSWHEEVWTALPRRSTYAVFDQAQRFWGSPVGRPNVFSFTTGADPTSETYYRQSPSRPRILCGKVVNLPYVDQSGPSQLQLRYTLNPGAVIKELIFGR